MSRSASNYGSLSDQFKKTFSTSLSAKSNCINLKKVSTYSLESEKQNLTHQLMEAAYGLYFTYNTITDTEGGLTEQILEAVEYMSQSYGNTKTLESHGDFMKKIQQIIEALLADASVQNMLKVYKNETGPYGGFTGKVKKVAEGILAKKVVEDLLHNRVDEQIEFADKTKKIITGILTHKISEESITNKNTQLEHCSGFYEKAKFLAEVFLMRRTYENVMPKSESERKLNKDFSDQAAKFSEVLLKAKNI